MIRCLWEREWQMHQRVLLLDCDSNEFQSGEKESSITHLLNTLQAP
jgi:hypothetical protein